MSGDQLLVPGLTGLQTGVHDLAVEVDAHRTAAERPRRRSRRGCRRSWSRTRPRAGSGPGPAASTRPRAGRPGTRRRRAGPPRTALCRVWLLPTASKTTSTPRPPVRSRTRSSSSSSSSGSRTTAAGLGRRHPAVHPLGEQQRLHSLQSQHLQQQQTDRPGAEHQGRATRSDARSDGRRAARRRSARPGSPSLPARRRRSGAGTRHRPPPARRCCRSRARRAAAGPGTRWVVRHGRSGSARRSAGG